MSGEQRPLFLNPICESQITNTQGWREEIGSFHKSLPEYSTTPLRSLPDVAAELHVQAVFVKDESNRFGLPSFKILGASWGAFQAVVRHLGLPLSADIPTIIAHTASTPVTLFTATDGNHGRAVSRIGKIFGVSVEIFVPHGMHPSTVKLLQEDGSTVHETGGTYDEAVQRARESAEQSNGILVQDTAFEGYEEIPQWIVEGYSTLLHEIDEQLTEQGVVADLVISPVGVGSFAQAVVSHYKAPGRSTKVLTVEPDSAACLYKSLRSGKAVAYPTYPTIMAGMDCGTVSSIAWPVLSKGVDASITVSDYEAHVGVLDLATKGVKSGPCGAATLSALRRLTSADRDELGLNEKSVIVLLSTEGPRDYDVPLDVQANDAITLTQRLVQINSANVTLGTSPGPGETTIARYIAAWLEHRDIEIHWLESTRGRPSIVGVVRGTGGGRSLMLNGHIDTVTLAGYSGDALSGDIVDGRIYGRGAADMKSGIAAALVALARTKQLALRGDLIVTGVADEEDRSIGTEEVLAAGWRADAAIVSEPTDLDIYVAHKGFVWFEVDILGAAAHGSRADLGIDAIMNAGHFLVALNKYSDKLAKSATSPLTGPPTIHTSLIAGGEEPSSYPAKCTITIEMRTIAGQTIDSVQQELTQILNTVQSEVKDFSFDIRPTFSRSPFNISKDDQFVKTVHHHVGIATKGTSQMVGGPFWTDCALLADAGISSLLWGPKGKGLHSKEEWVEADSVKLVSDTLVEIIKEFCA